MQAFTSLEVQPSYGNKSAIVSWDVDVLFRDVTKFQIFKSPDGRTNWQELNSSDYESLGTRVIIDKSFIVQNYKDNWHYVVQFTYNGKTYKSQSVGIYNELDKTEFAQFYQMLQAEYRHMVVSRAGIKYLICRPKLSGEESDSVDPISGMEIGNSLNECTSGQKFIGGYEDPFITYGIMLQDQYNANLDVNGNNLQVTKNIVIKTFAIPIIRQNDIIINPRTDDRYGVIAANTIYFKGKVPFMSDAQVTLLARTHSAYNIDISQWR